MGLINETTKRYLLSLISRSKRFFLDLYSDTSYQTILKATWNDTELPKDKHFCKIRDKINIHYLPTPVYHSHFFDDAEPYENEHSIITENIIRYLEERLYHYKWKVVLKTLLLMNKMSLPTHCGELAFLFYSNRPNIFHKTFLIVKNIPAYQDRARYINSLLNYFHIKLQNFTLIGRGFIFFEDQKELEDFLERRFTDKTFKKCFQEILVQLKYLLGIRFPDERFSNDITMYFRLQIYDEGCHLFGNIVNGVTYFIQYNKYNIESLKYEINRMLEFYTIFNFNYRDFSENGDLFNNKQNDFSIKVINENISRMKNIIEKNGTNDNKSVFSDLKNH